MSLKFPYVLHEGFYRPIINIDFLKPEGGLFEFDGLIDSGAPWCLFPGFIATLLGHKILKGKLRHMKIGGHTITAYMHKTSTSVITKDFVWDIYFSHDIDDWDFGILGQDLFFSNFEVTFNYPRKEILLKPF
ncbi:MAG: hypothetical protein V2A65_04630 [Candidatus Omnitrophota bacterium]